MEDIKLSDILLRDYVKNFIIEMSNLGHSRREICDKLVDVLLEVAKEEGNEEVFISFMKRLFSDWVENQLVKDV